MEINTEEALKAIIEQEGDTCLFIYKEYGCTLTRNYALGHWCGYVELKNTDNFHKATHVFCHGGITYANKRERIIGFDLGHSFDLSPFVIFDNEELFKSITNQREYRTKEYAIEQCKIIVDQLRELK